MKKAVLVILGLFVLMPAFLSVAQAKNPHTKAQNVQESPVNDVQQIIQGIAGALIGAEDRETIRQYLKNNNPHKCPPGLAKKNNGCLPPGQAKKYSLGKKLSSEADLRDLPDELLRQLKTINGYRYGKVDDDIVLIAEATKTVVDVITLFESLK